MRFALVDLAFVGLLGVVCASAQQAVPAAREPHHHTVYEDARVRILDVRIEPRGSMLLHRHDTDYIWVDAAGIHFSRGGMTHAERNHEVIVELLQPQTDPRNVCAEILASEYLHCREPGPEWLGADLANSIRDRPNPHRDFADRPGRHAGDPSRGCAALADPAGGRRSRGDQPGERIFGGQQFHGAS